MPMAEKPGFVRSALGLALAAGLVIAAFLAHQALVHQFGMTLPPFILVFPAVMVDAFLFGLGPGLLATALAAALVDYWLLEPIGQFGITRASDALALTLFSFVCIFVALVAERYRRSQRRVAVLESERALLETREQLQRVSESWRLALEAAGLGAWDYHLDTGLVTWDERCRNEFGFTTGDSLGYSELIANIHQDDRKGADLAMKAAIAGVNGGAYHREFRVVWPDGSVHWLASRGRVYFDGENGNRRATRFTGINTDITDRMQGESAFETILQRFYVILSNLNAAVLLVTDDGKVEFANKAFCDRFGLEDSAVSLAGLGSEEMIGKIKQAYRYPDEAVIRIGGIVQQGSAVTSEEISMRDGRACLRDFVPLRVEGKSYGRLWVHTDITERKQMETRLRRFYETDLFAILYWKIDGNAIDVNEQFLKMTGYTREDVRAGRVNWAKMTPPEYLAADEEARRQIRETGVHQSYEKEFIRKDGTRVWGQFWAAAYEDDRSEGVSFILDISERKRTEEDLRRAKREWERTFNSVPDLIAVLDNQHRIVRMNQAMAERLGVTPDGCAGLPCYTCVHGATAPIGICPHTLTLRDHREHAVELHEEGLGGDFLVTTTPMFNEHGEMDGTVHVARDITESKRAENALREGEKRYRNLFNAMNEGFCVIEVLFDAQGRPEDYRFLEVNDAFEMQTGLYDAVGKRMKALAPAHEKHWFEIYGRIALTGEPAHFMDEAKALDRYYDVHAYRVEEPEMRRVAIVFNDISEYKRAEEALRASEERLRLALDAGRMGTWDVNLLSGHFIWNDEMYLMMGYQPGSVTPNYEGWKRRLHPEDWAGAEERFRWSLERGMDLLSEYRVLGPNDEVRWVEARGRSERDANGRAVRSFGVVMDITERRRAEEALREEKATLQGILDATDESVWLIGADYTILSANATALKRVGRPAGEIVGKTVYETSGPELGESRCACIRRVVETAQPLEVEDERDQMLFRHHYYPVLDSNGCIDRVVVYSRDITQSKKAEETLQRYRLVATHARDIVLFIRYDDGLILEANAAAAEAYGYTIEQLQRMTIYDLREACTRPVAPSEMAQAEMQGILFESIHQRADGSVFPVEVSFQGARIGGTSTLISVIRDITERRRSEEALKKSEEQFRTLANAIPQLSWRADADGALIWYNDRWYEYTGTTAKEMEGWGWQSVHDPEMLPQVLERWRASIATGSPFEMVFPLRGTDGVFRPFLTRVMPLKDAEGKVVRWFGTNTDISGQKQIEGELRRNEERLNLALEVAQLGEWERDLKGGTSSRSLLHAQIFGYNTVDSEWNFNAFLEHVLPEYRAEAAEKLKSQQSGEVVDFETKIRRTDGEVRWIWVRSYTRQSESGEPERAYGIVQDITARKQVEEQLQKLNRTLKALSNCNQALLHSDDEMAFLHSVCRIVTEDCGYRMVWIGIAEDDEFKSVRPVAWSGFEDGYLQNFRLTWDESPDGRGPTGTAIRTGQPSMCRNMATDPAFAPWRAEATKRGYASSLVIPLKDGEQAMGAVTIYSAIPDAFSEGEINLLAELAGDLTFGIRTLRMRAAHAEAEAALRESEEQLGLFVEHAPVALAMFDNQMRYLRVSRRWKTDYRLDDRDVRGLSHYDVFPEISEQWRENHRRGLAGEVLHKDADRFERADGSAQWVRWEIRPWREHKGEIGGILIFSEEITDRKLAEDALREQAELLDLAHDTIMVFDLDGTIRFWNHGAEEMYGYTREEATGRKSHQLLSTVFPQPMDEIKAQVVRDGRWEGELAQVRKDGMGMIVDSRWVVQRDKDGHVRGVMEINSDITTRVKAEDAQREAHVKLQSVLDSITDGLLMLDNDWQFTYCSEHGARILGLRPANLLGGRFWQLFPHAEDSTFGEAFRSAVESRQPVHCEGFYPEPLNMWLECHCYPTPEGLSVYFRDISERKRTEEALLRSEKLASVGRMAATIAHEINNPLAAITNTLFIARMKADEPESVREFLDVAEDELKRITHITRQTLGFYRESSGPAVMSVNAVMDSAVDLMKSKISAKRAVIDKDWEGEAMVSAIAGELRQVFANLLGNSLDAIDEGGTIRLRVKLGSDFKGGRAARVTVADNGKGVAAGSKVHIFEPFYTTKGTVGTGLGLWVTKQIIDKHHGKIRLRSGTGGARRGTVFMVILPVEPPGMAQSETGDSNLQSMEGNRPR